MSAYPGFGEFPTPAVSRTTTAADPFAYHNTKTLDEKYRAAKEYLTSTPAHNNGSSNNHNHNHNSSLGHNATGNGSFWNYGESHGNYPDLSFSEFKPALEFSGVDFEGPARGAAHADANLSHVNFDQMRIGEQTMENVLKALDAGAPHADAAASTGYYAPLQTSYQRPRSFAGDPLSRSISGLNLDSSFASRRYAGYDLQPRKHSILDTSNLFSEHAALPGAGPAHAPLDKSGQHGVAPPGPASNRSDLIRSHQSGRGTWGRAGVSFQQPPAQFFASPEDSLGGAGLLPVDASVLLSGDAGAAQREAQKLGGRAPPAAVDLNREKELFLQFAAQQYRTLAQMHPDAARAPQSLQDLADRDAFRYWGRLLVEDRERQARVVLNLQKALTEALSGAAGAGPRALTHLGKAAAHVDESAEDVGRYADRCRRRYQAIHDFLSGARSAF